MIGLGGFSVKKNLSIAIVLTALLAAAAFAQEMTDVVYLKNGSIIRGTILELAPEISVKIGTGDGSVFVFKMEEVEKLAREKPLVAKTVSVAIGPTEPVPDFTLQVNALGFLQFGPFLKAEIKIAPSVFFTPHVRLHAFGIASQAVSMGDADTIGIDPTSLGIGIGIMRFFPTAGTANGVYSSVIGEYGWITAIKDKGKSWEWRTETLGLVIMTNVGYRWRTDRITYSLGLLLGGYFGLSEKWWYLNESYGSTEKRDGTTTTTAYGMLEASVGYAF